MNQLSLRNNRLKLKTSKKLPIIYMYLKNIHLIDQEREREREMSMYVTSRIWNTRISPNYVQKSSWTLASR
jgi:hypothetical protein